MFVNYYKSLKPDMYMKKKGNDYYKPNFHFLAPSNWMNDPNGLIYHNKEYHIFYQHNPKTKHWGNIHWGHAKTKDFINWEHLPIALSPSKEKKEKHCFSGTCIIDNKIPKILYTSINSLTNAIKGSRINLAIGDKDLLNWKKYEKNPVLINNSKQTKKYVQWRDPFTWKEKNTWYTIVGCQKSLIGKGTILIYSSNNLTQWKYVRHFIDKKLEFNKTIECPNLFKIQSNYILFASPMNKTKYSIGEFQNNKFQSEKWETLDHGKVFYAANGFKNIKKQLIFLGWIKKGGESNWNGCLSIPRILTTNKKNQIMIKPHPNLKKLRKNREYIKNKIISKEQPLTLKQQSNCFELEIKLNIQNDNIIRICLGEKLLFKYNKKRKKICSGKETGTIAQNKNKIKIHLFFDKSITETFLNNKETISSRIYPNKKDSKDITIKTKNKTIISELNFWKITPVTIKNTN